MKFKFHDNYIMICILYDFMLKFQLNFQFVYAVICLGKFKFIILYIVIFKLVQVNCLPLKHSSFFMISYH